MGSSEPPRPEPRKRKARTTGRGSTGGPREDEPIAASAAAAGAAEEESEGAIARGYARSEERNRAVREQLEPLAEGERPGAVTVGAILAAVMALIFWGSTVLAALDVHTIRGAHPRPLQVAIVALVFTTMAVGMWRARYWAVLGFQTLLVFLLLACAGGIVTGGSWAELLATLLLMAGAGALFYFMIRAMARIQMPNR